MPEQTAAVEGWARMLCAADVHVNDGDHPTWQQLSAMPGGQDEYRKAARWLLPRLTVGQPAPPSAPADADLRDRIRRACAEADGFRFACLESHDYQKHADAILALFPPSAYRRLLARLEADRASHLRAAGQATEEVLRIDGAVSASTLRHATAMAVHAFEGPDAAEAYMQRTEGGEAGQDPAVLPAPADQAADGAFRVGTNVRAELRRMADEAQQAEPECSASISGICLSLFEADVPCDTSAGECVHGGKSGDEQADRVLDERVAAAKEQSSFERSDVGTEFVQQIDNLDEQALAKVEAELVESGVETPGCDCGHDGMGVRWHDTACMWRSGKDEARQVDAAGEDR
jgi:hypothetical protein